MSTTEKVGGETIEHASHHSTSGGEEGVKPEAAHVSNFVPNEARDEDVVTFKTWIVVTILSASYGLSFWMVPVLAAIQGRVATDLGDPTASGWWTTVYTMTTAISFMLFGGNSDLFGRRWFIISGNVAVFVGLIVIGTARNTNSITAGCACIGMGAGLCQLAAFALPELLPNRIRHIGILIADLSTWIAVLFGPIIGRYSISIPGDSWRWGFYAPAIATGISFILLVWLYHPPRHPRGIPWGEAVKQLDYVGALLFTAGAVMVFTGVIWVTIIPASDPRVIGLLVAGFALIAAFAAWETIANPKQALTPPWIFAQDKGREFTFPFIAGTIVNMFFYSINIAYPTAINVLWTDASTPLGYSIALTLPQNLGLIFGSVLLWVFGSPIGHWKWQLIGSFSVMTIFGALLALANPNNMAMIMVFCFIAQGAYGWAQNLSITWIQFGVPQTELGTSGALAGVARWTGGALSASIYLAILTNVQSMKAAELIPAAVVGAGGTQSTGSALVAAFPLGAEAIGKVAGATPELVAAAGGAFVESYVVGLRTMCLTSIAFGVLAIICCCLSNDIGPKMTNKIEVFLENDVQADKNRFHNMDAKN